MRYDCKASRPAEPAADLAEFLQWVADRGGWPRECREALEKLLPRRRAALAEFAIIVALDLRPWVRMPFAEYLARYVQQLQLRLQPPPEDVV